MNRKKELEKIALEIEKCKICKKGKIGKAVPGEGSAFAKIMFVGEAPGKNESIEGRPFIGRSGKLLRKMINDIGLKDEDVFITSPVKYLPIKKTPSKKDIEHGKIHFLKQVEVIDPKVIVLLGKTASFAMLNQDIPTLKRHGEIIEREGKKYFLTLHPAAVLRFKKYEEIFREDFKKIEKLAYSLS